MRACAPREDTMAIRGIEEEARSEKPEARRIAKQIFYGPAALLRLLSDSGSPLRWAPRSRRPSGCADQATLYAPILEKAPGGPSGHDRPTVVYGSFAWLNRKGLAQRTTACLCLGNRFPPVPRISHVISGAASLVSPNCWLPEAQIAPMAKGIAGDLGSGTRAQIC